MCTRTTTAVLLTLALANLTLAQENALVANIEAEGSVNGLLGAVLFEEGDLLSVTYAASVANYTGDSQVVHAEIWLENWEHQQIAEDGGMPFTVPPGAQVFMDYELQEENAQGWEYYSSGRLFILGSNSNQDLSSAFRDFWM